MNELMKKRYLQQRAQARMRKIPFTITFEEWSELWISSGKWEQRGTRKDQYCMSRVGDKGGYEVGNVFIQLQGDNVRDAQIGRVRTAEELNKLKLARANYSHSDETKRKISNSRMGQPSANKGKTGQVPWNKGLTKDTDKRVRSYSMKRTLNKLIKENKLCV
jgi:hypothetical protein